MTTELAPRQRWLVFLACMAALFTAAVEGTIVATAMPTIVADLGGFSLLAWVFAAYMLTQAVTIPIYGRLADLYGRRRVIFFGLGLFLVGCVLCGFAPSMLWLVIFRAIQGIGAGAVLPITLTIIGDCYPALERVRVQPYVAAVFAGSSIIGPVLGAFILEHTGWQVIFWAIVPVGVLAVVLLAILFKEQPRVVQHNIDITGALLLMMSITGVLLAMLQSDKLGWWILPLVAASLGVFMLFLRVEKRTPEPLLPPVLWRNPTLLACNLGAFGVGASLMAVSAFLPTYLQGVLGQSVFASGVALSVMSFSWPVAATIGSRVMVRTTYRTTAVFGGALVVVGSLTMAILVALPPHTANQILDGWWPVIPAFLIGSGLGMVNSANHISMQEATVAYRGIATATQAFMRMMGSAFGTAILGTVLNLSLAWKLPGVHDPVQTMMDPAAREKLPVAEAQRMAEGVGQSLDNLFWVAFVIALLTAAAAWLTPHVRPGTMQQPDDPK